MPNDSDSGGVSKLEPARAIPPSPVTLLDWLLDVVEVRVLVDLVGVETTISCLLFIARGDYIIFGKIIIFTKIWGRGRPRIAALLIFLHQPPGGHFGGLPHRGDWPPPLWCKADKGRMSLPTQSARRRQLENELVRRNVLVSCSLNSPVE